MTHRKAHETEESGERGGRVKNGRFCARNSGGAELRSFLDDISVEERLFAEVAVSGRRSSPRLARTARLGRGPLRGLLVVEAPLPKRYFVDLGVPFGFFSGSSGASMVGEWCRQGQSKTKPDSNLMWRTRDNVGSLGSVEGRSTVGV